MATMVRARRLPLQIELFGVGALAPAFGRSCLLVEKKPRVSGALLFGRARLSAEQNQIVAMDDLWFVNIAKQAFDLGR